MLVEIKQKSQVTIPVELLKKMNLKTGDKLEIEEHEGRLVITPVVVIPREQIWYYAKEWQQDESEAQRQIQQGRLKIAGSKDELYAGLGLDEL